MLIGSRSFRTSMAAVDLRRLVKPLVVGANMRSVDVSFAGSLLEAILGARIPSAASAVAICQ